ncbi:MAG: DivIVA domain-containing protein [Oscillospiraceae bacterium]|nr:DivIVA domain-containing protein [Oscillospiraceae bacterium]
MLTPDKIKEKQFQSSGRGSYRADDVDAFMNEVSASYEQMFKENGDLIRKISILAKKVEEYRADEESLKLALLNAQKLADQIVAEAKEKAQNETSAALAEAEKKVADANAQAEELTVNSKRESAAIVESAKAEAERIVADANKKADEVLGNINRKVTHETLVFDMTKREASEFKSKLVAMYKEHINLINQLPEIVDEQLDAEENTEVAPEETAAPEAVAEAPAVEDVAEEAVAEIEEIAEPSIEEPEITEPEIAVEEEPEVPEEVSAPVFEDIYSDSAEQEEAPAEAIEEPVKENAFKLDLSKIDFSDDDDEPDVVAEPAEPARTFGKVQDEEPEDDDDDNGSISFKNFFKKK